MRPDPGYSPADERRDRADDRTQLIKVRAMAEALMREMRHPMHTKAADNCLVYGNADLFDALQGFVADELNPTIESLEE